MTVFPSLYEPFGIVALEVTAAGVPQKVRKAFSWDEMATETVRLYVSVLASKALADVSKEASCSSLVIASNRVADLARNQFNEYKGGR